MMSKRIAASLFGCILAGVLPGAAIATTVTRCAHNVSELQSDLAEASDSSNTDDHVIHLRDGTYLAPSGGFTFFQNTNHRLDLEGGFFGLNGGNGCDLQIQSAGGTILDGRGDQTIFTVISNGATSGNITFRYLTFQHGGGDGNAFRVVMNSNTGTLRVENDLFIDNSTTVGTVDILNVRGITYFLDNAVVGNTVQANLSQSALRIESGPSASVTAFINNNTIAGNRDTQGELSPSLWIIGGSTFDFANNIVWNSDSCDINAGSESGDPLPAVNYDDNDIDSACVVVPPAGSGTIDEDPHFIDAANGNFRLMPDSPARDAGDDSPPGTTRDVDLDGRPRVVGRVDMAPTKSPITSSAGASRAEGRIRFLERADRHPVAVRVSERELLRSGVGVEARFFVEPLDQRACPLQRCVEIVDADEQQQAVARPPTIGTRERRMLVRAPFVQAQQHRSVRVEELAPVVVRRMRRRLAEQRLVPRETSGHVAHADDRPRSFHCSCLMARPPHAERSIVATLRGRTP